MELAKARDGLYQGGFASRILVRSESQECRKDELALSEQVDTDEHNQDGDDKHQPLR